MSAQEWQSILEMIFGHDIARWVFLGGVLLVALWWLRKKTRPWLLQGKQMLTDWVGADADPLRGIPERPGVMRRLKNQDDEIAVIKGQVVPNHGSQKKLSEEVQQVQSDVKELGEGLRALAERFEQHLKK